jgi:hypothetical protein
MDINQMQILSEIIQNTNSILTTDSENDKPFVIIEDWNDLGKIQKELNKKLNPITYYKWLITYYNEYGNNAFQEMRLGWTKESWDKTKQPCNIHRGFSPYVVPNGLTSLDDIMEWGFSDEYITCSNCYKAIATTPNYYGDKPRYAIINDEILCGDCILND